MTDLLTTDLESLTLLHRGKVRDMYALDSQRLLMVASDRISAFDVVLPTPIPGKGQTLTELSRFWFDKTRSICANHWLDDSPSLMVQSATEREQIKFRAAVVKRLKPIPVEAVVRGYLVGSGWQEYLKNQTVCGIALPDKLEHASALPDAIFTPARKAILGEHDENISFTQMQDLIGTELAQHIKTISLQLYAFARQHAESRGVIIADTKFEFGLDANGELILMDELLTPDSSRFWPQASYCAGINPPSFDKQFVRDYLETLDWNKTAPGPKLPKEIVEQTSARYRQALELLSD